MTSKTIINNGILEQNKLLSKSQWYTFGIGFTLFSWSMFWGTNECSTFTNNAEILISCFIRRYAFVIPALISQFLGIIFIICGWLEK